ncbi:MAG: hypothetical protein GH145_02365 [Firmicutes bacterium]|nr:hypothetical protein [Bacillota bacterium]
MILDKSIFLGKSKPIVKTEDFEADGRSQILLNLPGYYNEILLKIDLEIQASDSPEAEADTYPLARVIKALEIQADNSRPFLELPTPYAGMLLEIFDQIMLKGSLYVPSLPDAGETATVSYQIPYHCGDDFLEKWDTSDVIAKRGLSNLVLTVNWGAASDLGDNYIINSGTIQAVVNYILLQPGVTEQRAFAPKGWVPGQLNARGKRIVPAFWQPGTKVAEVNYPTGTALGEKTVNFLNGFFLRDVLFLVFDSTGALREDVISRVKIETKDGIELFNATFREIMLDNMRDHNYYTPLTGVGYIDLRELLETPKTGRKLVEADDLQWKLTLAEANSTVVFMYRIHHPAEALAKIAGLRPAEMAV